MSFQHPTPNEAQLLYASLFLPRPALRALHSAARAADLAAADAVIPAPRTETTITAPGVIAQRVHVDA